MRQTIIGLEKAIDNYCFDVITYFKTFREPNYIVFKNGQDPLFPQGVFHTPRLPGKGSRWFNLFTWGSAILT